MHWLEPHLEKRTHVIWDWNGTILDDVDVAVRSMAKVLEKYSMPLVSREEYLHRFRFPVADYYKALGFDFEKVPFKEVADQFMAHYQEAARHCQLHEGMREVFEGVNARGIAQSILTAARQEHVQAQMEPHDIGHFFENICGIADHFAASKVARGHELMKKIATPPQAVLLVGDTDHDIEVANSLGIDVLIVADGHQHYDRLHPIHAKVVKSRAHGK